MILQSRCDKTGLPFDNYERLTHISNNATLLMDSRKSMNQQQGNT